MYKIKLMIDRINDVAIVAFISNQISSVKNWRKIKKRNARTAFYGQCKTAQTFIALFN